MKANQITSHLLTILVLAVAGGTAAATSINYSEPVVPYGGYAIGVTADNLSVVGVHFSNLSEVDGPEEQDELYNRTMNYSIAYGLDFKDFYNGSAGKSEFINITEDTLRVLKVFEVIGKLDATTCDKVAPCTARYPTDVPA